MNLELLKYFFSKSYRSFSQNGEDLLINKYFQGKKNGFYIDVGSNHPVILNNTYFFYRRGWKGITIEASDKFNVLYKILRPRDIHINEYVSDIESECYYYIYKDHVFNTLSERELNDKNIVNRIKIKTKPFDVIVNPYLKELTQFDLLSIDIENYSKRILNTLPLLLLLPELIILEIENFDIESVHKYPEIYMLKELNYELFSIVFNNLLFKKTKKN